VILEKSYWKIYYDCVFRKGSFWSFRKKYPGKVYVNSYRRNNLWQIDCQILTFGKFLSDITFRKILLRVHLHILVNVHLHLPTRLCPRANHPLEILHPAKIFLVILHPSSFTHSLRHVFSRQTILLSIYPITRKLLLSTSSTRTIGQIEPSIALPGTAQPHEHL